MRHKLGRLQRGILSRLHTGRALDWEDENSQSLDRAIAALYQARMLTERVNQDGSVTLLLSAKGNKYALTADIDKMEVSKPRRWDKKWRVVLSDIPENRKSARDALREHFKQLHFVEFQKSVWVHAYDCGEQIEFLAEFYEVRRYVRYGLLEHIDNDLHLRRKFDLL